MDCRDLHLRPARAEDFWLLERQAVDPEAGGEFNWSGYRDVQSLRRRFDENGLIGPDGGYLVVVADDAAVGTVVWTKVTHGIAAWWCWTIGISLSPEHRGRGFGTAAQKLLVSYLFETGPVERIQAFTDIDNLVQQRILEKLGFRREGELRSVQFRQGRWRDMFLYALLRADYRALA